MDEGVLKRMTSNHKVFVVGLITVIFTFHPMFLSGFLESYDGEYHLARLNTLYDSLTAGIFPVKVHPAMAQRYGYGTGLFYPNLFLYYPAVLMLLGCSLEIAMKILILTTITGIFFCTYYICFSLTHSQCGSLFMAVLWTAGNAVMGATYWNFAPSIVLACCFLPLAIGGLYGYLTEKLSFLPMTWGFIGLLYSHTISAFLAGCTCFILVVFMTGEWLKRPRRILGICVAAGLTLTATASYWLTMWQQFRSMTVKAQAPWALERDHIPEVQQFFIGVFGPGWVLCALVLLGMIMWCILKKRGRADNGVLYFLGTSVILIVVAYSKRLWTFLNAHGVHLIQFPGRIFIPLSVCALFCCLMVMADWFRKRETPMDIQYRVLIFGMIICFLCAYTNIRGRYSEHSEASIQKVLNGTAQELGGGEEWLPLNMMMSDLNTPETAYGASGNAVIGKKYNHDQFFTFEAHPGEKYYLLPFVYYRGYTALNQENGERLLTTEDTETGLLKVFMPENSDDLKKEILITSWFQGTGIMRLSYVISLIGWISMIGLSLRGVWNEKHRP